MAVPGARLDRVRGALRKGAPPPPGKLLELPSARVHVQVRGAGPTVVYIPDPPNGLDSVAGLLDRLAEDHRVVAFELPGFGWSRGRAGFGFRMRDHARVLEEVMDATGTAQATFIAPCIGGFAALAFAASHPERVERLVLPQLPDWQAAHDWADRVDPGRRLRRPWLGQAVTVFAQDLIATRWYRIAEPDVPRQERFVALFRARPRAGRLFSIATGLLSLDDADPVADGGLDMPVLLLWGEGDRSHPREHAHTLAPCFGRATCETIAAGHFPDVAAPERVVEWLRRSGAAAPAPADRPIL